MRRIGLLLIGHRDYLDSVTGAIQVEATELLSRTLGYAPPTEGIAVDNAGVITATRKLIFQHNCCGLVIVLASWVECDVVMSALKELRGLSFMLWGIPVNRGGGETIGSGSYVSAAMLNGVVNRLKLPCDVLIAGTKTKAAETRVANFASAASAIDELFYARIGLFGYTSMSIYPGTFDHVLMRYRIGPEIEQMDSFSLIRRAERADASAVERAREKLAGLARIHENVSETVLRQTLSMYVALSDFCREKSWNAVNVKCQYELSKEYRVVPCVALSLLAEEGVTASCEGDIPNTVSMLLLHALAEQTVWYGDALTHWENVVQFSPCGYMPLSLACGQAMIQKFMEHPGFSGIQVFGVMRPERITFLRLVEDIGSYHILYGTGQGTETTPRGGCMPALNVRLDGSMDALMQAYAGQHFAIAYGDLSEKIEAFGKLMGIECVRI